MSEEDFAVLRISRLAWLGVLSVVFVVGIAAYVWLSASLDQTVGMAILVAGYFMFPVLAILAAGLLLIALLVFVAHLQERRRLRP
jgi:uncharacterized membrane protein